jgi:hypothetical protein
MRRIKRETMTATKKRAETELGMGEEDEGRGKEVKGE